MIQLLMIYRDHLKRSALNGVLTYVMEDDVVVVGLCVKMLLKREEVVGYDCYYASKTSFVRVNVFLFNKIVIQKLAHCHYT